MNEYKIIFSNQFYKDIDLISEYIFRFTFDILISEKFIDSVYSSIYSLKILPYRHIEYKNNIRIITIKGKYKVFYKVDEESKKVLIYRIFSSLQNYDSLFKN